MFAREQDWPYVLWMATRSDPAAMQQLEDLAVVSPVLCSAHIRAFIESDEYGDEMGVSELLNTLVRVDGLAIVSEWILLAWPTLSLCNN